MNINFKCSRHYCEVPCGACAAEADYNKQQFQKNYERRMKELNFVSDALKIFNSGIAKNDNGNIVNFTTYMNY